MDLMRAVIIGAQGTPYHDGLFFFDIFFPNRYPDIPPVGFFFSSFGSSYFSYYYTVLRFLTECFLKCSKFIITLRAFDLTRTCIIVGKYV